MTPMLIGTPPCGPPCGLQRASVAGDEGSLVPEAELAVLRQGVVAVWVVSAETEDVSRLEDVPEGALHLAQRQRAARSGAVEQGVVAVWVGNAETEDGTCVPDEQESEL